MSAEDKSPGYTGMPNAMSFRSSDLLANVQKHKNVANERRDGWTIIPISVDKLRARHLDTSACQSLCHSYQMICHLETSACQNVDFFFQAICSQFQNPVFAQNAYFKTPGNALSDQISFKRRVLIFYAADGIESVLCAINDD